MGRGGRDCTGGGGAVTVEKTVASDETVTVEVCGDGEGDGGGVDCGLSSDSVSDSPCFADAKRAR